jgi:hypothetical protein
MKPDADWWGLTLHGARLHYSGRSATWHRVRCNQFLWLSRCGVIVHEDLSLAIDPSNGTLPPPERQCKNCNRGMEKT